jgi:rSAM/selenodomain-associated transferase 1
MSDAAVAVFAKAPVPGYAKTRLVPLLGAEGAARLQAELIEGALLTALAAALGPVTLWCAPDERHPFFQEAARRFGLSLAGQPKGDLGERMLAAFGPAGRPLVLIGSDCPVLTPADLREAVARLADADAAIAPAEDGGYGLIAARAPLPALFGDVPWGTRQVLAVTRERARACGLGLAELRTVWDVDTPADFARLAAIGLVDAANFVGAAPA